MELALGISASSRYVPVLVRVLRITYPHRAIDDRTCTGHLLRVPVLAPVLLVLPKYCTIAIGFSNVKVYRNGIEKNCDGKFISPHARYVLKY